MTGRCVELGMSPSRHGWCLDRRSRSLTGLELRPRSPHLALLVVAFVVADDATSAPSVEELDELCLEQIARYKRPKDYRFVASLPTNNYGKVLKRELREQLVHEA